MVDQEKIMKQNRGTRPLEFIFNASEMAHLIKAHDWKSTKIGSPDNWPQELKSTLTLCLDLSSPSVIFWGEDNIIFYNDPWMMLMAANKYSSLGKTGREVFSDSWESIEQQINKVYTTGRSVYQVNQPYPLNKNEELYFNNTYNPVRGNNGEISGILKIAFETTQLIKAEKDIRKSKERYQNLFESIDQGFCIIQMLFDENGKPNDYRFIEINPTFEKQTGLKDVIGKRVRQLVPNLEEHWFQKYGQVALTGKFIRFEDHAEQMNRWFTVHAQPVGYPKERKVALLFKDITERKEAEYERERLLREVETERKKLAAIFHEAPSFMCILRGPDHVFERANNFYQKLIGFSEIIGKPVKEALPEIENQGFIEILDKVYQTGESFSSNDFPVMMQTERGNTEEERILNFVYQPLRGSDGSITGIFVQGIDLTERKQIETSLREREELYRGLFESIDQGFCIIKMLFDDEGLPIDYKFIEANPTFKSQSGLNDVVGKTMRQLVPDHEDHWFELYGKVAETGESIRTENFAEKLNRWFDAYAYRVGKPAEKKVAVLFSDITTRKRTEFLLLEQKRLLELIATGKPLEYCLSSLCEAVPRHNPHALASILILDRKRHVFSRVINPDIKPSFGEGLENITIDDPSSGPCGKAVSMGKPVTSTNVEEDDQWSQEWRNLCLTHNIRATHSTPIFDSDGQPLASFMLCFDQPRKPDEWEHRLADFGAYIASIAIERDQAEEAIGKPGSIIFIDDDKSDAAEKAEEEKLLAFKKGSVEDERPHIRKNGSIFWASGMMMSMADGQGNVTGYVKILQDESERKRIEDRDKFLIRLDDVTRPLNDPNEIITMASRELGNHLKADRCLFFERESSEVQLLVTGVYSSDNMPKIEDTFAISEYGNDLKQKIRKNKSCIIDDITKDSSLSDTNRINYERLAIRAHITIPLHKSGRFIAGLSVQQKNVRQWSLEDIHISRLVLSRCWEAIERARVTRNLKESEEQLQRSLKYSPIPVIMHAEDGEVLQISNSWMELTGYSIEDASVFKTWLSEAYGTSENKLTETIKHLFRNKKRTWSDDFEIQTRNGETRIWNFSASSPGKLKDGRRFMVGMALDITERKLAANTQRLLLGELNHRVKNTLATIQAIASQTLRQTSNPSEFVANFNGRLKALAAAHSLLTRSSWKGAFISEILRQQLALKDYKTDRIEINGPPIFLSSQSALHLALVLHELGTNAHKHGSLSTSSGKVKVSWDATSTNEQLKLSWIEVGGPKVKQPGKTGFGKMLIEQSLKGVGGDAILIFTESGLKCEITLPHLNESKKNILAKKRYEH